MDVEAEFVTRVDESGRLQKFVRLPDGQLLSAGNARRAEALARYARFGALDPRFAYELDTTEDTDEVPAVIYFDVGTSLSRMDLVPPGAHSARRQAQDSLRAEISNVSAELLPALATLGLTDLRVSSAMPAVYASGTPPALRNAARLAEVTLITTNRVGRGVLNAATNSTTFHSFDSVINNPYANYAGSQRVGFVEVPYCGIRHEHESFDFIGSLNYAQSPIACSTDGDCIPCLGNSGIQPAHGMHRCLNGTCRWQHVYQVASVVSASRTSEPWAAGKASLFFANKGAVPPGAIQEFIICYAEGLDTAYSYLLEKDVDTVNESFECDNFTGGAYEDGLTQDYYARFHDMTISKAAGNDSEYACLYSLNSICVGATDDTGSLTSFTASVNPPSSDREEPDIVALGEGVEVAAWNGNTGNDVANGTSFSAPAVAALVALMKESCKTQSHRYYHAVLRNAAYLVNPLGDWYSTPRPGIDHQDGAGLLTALAMAYCDEEIGEGGPEGGSSDGIIDLTSFGPLPGMEPGNDPGEPHMQTIGLPMSGNSRVGTPIWEAEMKAGARLRFTLVWDSCPTGTSSTSGPAPTTATDLDLGLYHKENDTWIYWSASYDDTVEGFDVAVEEDGDYQVWVMAEERVSGCTGDFEPAAWAWYAWW